MNHVIVAEALPQYTYAVSKRSGLPVGFVYLAISVCLAVSVTLLNA